jgi:hypothetical protein
VESILESIWIWQLFSFLPYFIILLHSSLLLIHSMPRVWIDEWERSSQTNEEEQGMWIQLHRQCAHIAGSCDYRLGGTWVLCWNGPRRNKGMLKQWQRNSYYNPCLRSWDLLLGLNSTFRKLKQSWEKNVRSCRGLQMWPDGLSAMSTVVKCKIKFVCRHSVSAFSCQRLSYLCSS